MVVDTQALATWRTELETGMQLPKCQKCGCMADTLKRLATAFPAIGLPEAAELGAQVSEWLEQMRTVQYACLGCEHCYPAAGQEALMRAFPQLEALPVLSCEFQVSNQDWPPVVGEYFILDRAAPVAVSTLASVELAKALADHQPPGLAIVGKTETENIGIDKVIKNVITQPALKFLVLAGNDPRGHAPGQTLLALAQNGVDEQGRVIGSPGKRPILRNVTAAEIEAFRQRVQVIDLIGCVNPEEIEARVQELARPVEPPASCGCSERSECSTPTTISISVAPKVLAAEPSEVVPLDRAGYFVILPLRDRDLLHVEHYAYDDTLLRVVEGKTARALYATIIKEGWVSELSHAAYLGKELAKAELALQYGFNYVQDGA